MYNLIANSTFLQDTFCVTIYYLTEYSGNVTSEILPVKYSCIAFSYYTAKLLSHKIIYAHGVLYITHTYTL